MTDFRDRYGAWAVVAGGSEGMGLAFAADLARRGCDLVLVAHEEEPLRAAAASLRAGHGVDVRTCVHDLTRPLSAEAVAEEVADLEVGLLVWVAADPAIGPLLEQDVERLRGVVACNVTGPLVLTRLLARPMVERGHGGIVLLSSLSAIHGSATIATYAATKAFNRVLGEGLWAELGTRGVDVLTAMPGATDTPGYRASRPTSSRGLAAPADVARSTLDRLGRGPSVVPGRGNRVSAVVLDRLLSTRSAVRLLSRVTARLYDR